LSSAQPQPQLLHSGFCRLGTGSVGTSGTQPPLLDESELLGLLELELDDELEWLELEWLELEWLELEWLELEWLVAGTRMAGAR